MHETLPNYISYRAVFDEEFDGNVRFYPPAHRLPELEIRPLPVAALGRATPANKVCALYRPAIARGLVPACPWVRPRRIRARMSR